MVKKLSKFISYAIVLYVLTSGLLKTPLCWLLEARFVKGACEFRSVRLFVRYPFPQNWLISFFYIMHELRGPSALKMDFLRLFS